MNLILTLLGLALDAIDLTPEEVHEARIEQGFGQVWCVLIGNQEVFLNWFDGELEAYHVNCYDEDEVSA